MTPHRFASAEELAQALGAERFLVFKHSLICPTSERAFREYERWLASEPDLPSAWLDVIGQRPWSQEVAARTGVAHASPQALLLVRGRATWNASHGAITAGALRIAQLQAGLGSRS
jgi:bacillithiol system protein YtxJ